MSRDGLWQPSFLLHCRKKPTERRHALITIAFWDWRVHFRWKTENKDERKGKTHQRRWPLAPPEHSQPHSTQLQTTENVCRGSSSLSPRGIPRACTPKYVYIAIKVWHCASWQMAPQTGPDFECASVSPWQHLITPSVFSAGSERAGLSLEMWVKANDC